MGLKTELSEKIIDCYQELLNTGDEADCSLLSQSVKKSFKELLDEGYTPSSNTTNAFLKVMEICTERMFLEESEGTIQLILKAGAINNRNDLVTTILTNLLYWSITLNPEICDSIVKAIADSITDACPYLIVARAYYQILQYYIGLKKFEKCPKYFDKLEAIVRVVNEPRIFYYYYLSYGCYYYARGDLYKAIHNLSRVVRYKDNPPDSNQYYRAHYLLALSYASNMIMDKAIRHIDVLLNEDSGFNREKMLSYKTRMLSQNKEYDKAEEILNELIESNKGNKEIEKKVYADLFMIALMQDDDKKISMYYTLLDDESMVNVAPLFKDYYYLHISALDKIDIEAIMEKFDKSDKAKSPYSRQFLNFLVEYYIKKHDYENAYSYLQKLLAKISERERQYKEAELESYLDLLEKYEEFKTEQMSKRELVSSLEKDKLEKSIIGKSLEFRKVLGDCKIIANAHFSNVLITGETGTGKELIAKLIHYYSNRRSNNFCEINLSAMSPSLIESELFGYKKGAFTGALEDKKGLLEIVNNGTLFLDEISEIPPEIQTKLLKVLEEKNFYPLGSTKPVSSNFRLICATNQNLIHLTKEDKYRLDLYYRISNYEINLPPLRERKSDIPLLVDYFITMYSSKMGAPVFCLTKEQMNRLIGFDYSGNVRELKNLMQRVVISYHNSLSIDRIIDEYINPKEVRSNFETYNLEQIEKEAIIRALNRTMGVQSKAAKLLGISNNAIARKIAKYSLKGLCN